MQPKPCKGGSPEASSGCFRPGSASKHRLKGCSGHEDAWCLAPLYRPGTGRPTSGPFPLLPAAAPLMGGELLRLRALSWGSSLSRASVSCTAQ